MIQSASRSSSDAFQRLQGARNELVRKLLQNSDYRALVAIDRALDELSSGIDGGEDSSRAPAKPAPFGAANKLSQTEAAAQILSEIGRPLPLDELVRGLVERGVTFRGKRPELSLSASLSSNKQFRSIRFEGARCWWLSNRPIPPRMPVEAASKAALSKQA